MGLEDYKELIRTFEHKDYQKEEQLNLSTNFKIYLGIEHKEFCEKMISSGKFRYQSYAPEYDSYNSYLFWHEDVLEFRVMNRLNPSVLDYKGFSKEVQKEFNIIAQAHGHGKTNLILPEERTEIKKRAVLYLLDFVENEKISLLIPSIYYPTSRGYLLYLPDSKNILNLDHINKNTEHRTQNNW